eukprot:TRINITY_DN30571_c0_g1_i2.p1 TRINITY_DN30571_c0_g1~~TRINITY_DN30571_c0_g1_i2.p1  ORF type:complete len:628 (+),score=110.60 TRINITY_DN30571_c0_g1_i2:28-1884(+)
MPLAQRLKEVFAVHGDGQGLVKTSQLAELLRLVCSPALQPADQALLVRCAEERADDSGQISYTDFIDFLCAGRAPLVPPPPLPPAAAIASGKQVELLEKKLQTANQELGALRNLMKRQPFEFTIGQYNILAGYLGNNMEPWFLYGIDMPEERRQKIIKLHGERLPCGKPANAGWPNYVKGVLSEDEIAQVERVHKADFAWDARKDRLLRIIREMDCDLLSLVECDHFEDHFGPVLTDMGYEVTWKKRPRPNSTDGCCIAWRRGIFRLLSSHHVEYVDKYCQVTKKTYKDRIALMVLLQVEMTGQSLCFVSTHLQRNPEDPKQDMLRARQVGQVLRELGAFASLHSCEDAPVVLSGDLNCTSFGRLRGIANTVSILSPGHFLHPFTFDSADVPTGVTSVTTARCMRIDAIMYQAQRLQLVEVVELPELDPMEPIPNGQHPSDHVPIVAQFRMQSQLSSSQHMAKEWYLCLTTGCGSTPLNRRQLQNAFKLYDTDGDGRLSFVNLRKTLTSLFGLLPDSLDKIFENVKFPVPFDGFVSMYLDAVKELEDAFHAFDTDGNGTLNEEELLRAFETCAPATVPQESLVALFKAIDASGDGSIDLNEMMSYLARAWADKIAISQ